MELIPESPDIQRHLPMHHVAEKITAGNEFYSLEEKAYGHLVLRAGNDNLSVDKAVKQITGLDLPRKALSSVSNDDFTINWISPDEWLILVEDKSEWKIESALRDVIKGHYAIVNVTGGQTVLELSGKRAETVLKKSSTYDIHISNFPINKVVTSNFAKSQAVMRRTGDDSFQLIIRRSFSDYIWQWIVDAGSRA